MIVLVAVLAGAAGLTAAVSDGPGFSVRLSRDDRIAGTIDLEDIVPPDVTFVVPDPPVVATIPPEELIPVLPPRFPIDIGDRMVPRGECPDGEPTVEVTQFHVRRTEGLPGADEYDVHVEGIVRNESSEHLVVWSIGVTIDSEPPHRTETFVDDGGLDPGQSTTWQVDTRLRSERPPAATRTDAHWTWDSVGGFGDIQCTPG
jgi:hypothetical protein